MDNLKQIDNILKKAVADMPNSGHNLSSDWDAIEKKLPKPNSNITSIIAIGLILVTSSLLIISSYIGTENSSKKIITSSNPLKENISTDLVKEFQQNENTNTFHSNDEIEM